MSYLESKKLFEDDPNIEIVKFTDRVIYFYLKEVTITYKDQQYPFYNVPIRLVPDGRVDSFDNNYQHPHISIGSICIGRATYIKNQARSEPYTAAKALEALLSNYGHSNPYYNISMFDTTVKLCHMCSKYKKQVMTYRGINYCMETACADNASYSFRYTKCNKCSEVLTIRDVKKTAKWVLCQKCQEENI